MEMYLILIVAAVVAMVLIKNFATQIYRKTGVNTLNAAHKILWYVQMVGLVFAFGEESLALMIATVVGGIALHAILTLKAGIPNAVITGVLQGIGGGIIAVVNAFLFVLGMFTGNKLGGMFNLNTEAQNAQKQLEAQATPRMKNESPDAYAQRLGFRDADDAERAGVDTRKHHR